MPDSKQHHETEVDATAKFSVSRRRNKPRKPFDGFPLFPHATGRWAKNNYGKFHYFGRISDDPSGEKARAQLNREWTYRKDVNGTKDKNMRVSHIETGIICGGRSIEPTDRMGGRNTTHLGNIGTIRFDAMILALCYCQIVFRRTLRLSTFAFAGYLLLFTVGCDDEAPRNNATKLSDTASATVHVSDVFPFPRPSAQGYVTSDACRKCHPDEHSSWHASYHRKMTQPATPETMLAPFDGVQLEVAGSTARLERRGNEFWVDIVDPEWEREAYRQGRIIKASLRPRVQRRILMTTGSHNFQVFWYARGRGSELWQFAWRYHLAEKRWLHRRDVFLEVIENWGPGMMTSTWNKSCIVCHSTGGNPGWKPGDRILQDTQVAELGIACEMCHGRGKAHVRAMKLLNTEKAATRTETVDGADLRIVNPRNLNPQASVDVCGQCHSHVVHPLEVFTKGPIFQPGMELRRFFSFDDVPQEHDGSRRFWEDGTNCSGGREYHGVIASACFTEGQMTCLSCHSMHHSDPNRQLAAEMGSNQACYQCHASYREKLVEHTHHPANSSGSLCYNCHMPYTSSALMKAIRSHRIQSPRIEPTRFNSQPNACNLCHLDETLGWSAQRLTDWYGQTLPDLSNDEHQIAASLLWMLRGDPLQRSIAVWHTRYPPAQKASGTDWMAPFVAELLNDDYPAVRWVASLSLRTLPGFREFEYEFDGTHDEKSHAIQRARMLWSESASPVATTQRRTDRLLLIGPRRIQSDVMRRLVGERDDRNTRLVE